MIAADTKAYAVHAGLLAVGAEAGIAGAVSAGLQTGHRAPR